MASTTNNYIEEHKDFVLKLKIKATDGTSQIRRVRLPRIADGEGNVSYEELVGLVVTFTFPDESSPENYNISLTYFDVDEDTVTIASTDELSDAIEQFSGKNLLRITTEVKLKTKADSPQTSTSTRQDRGTSTWEPSIQPQIHNVLESFVGVLATAVSGLQEGLAKPSSYSRPAPTSTPPSAAASNETSTSEEAVPEVATSRATASCEDVGGETAAKPEPPCVDTKQSDKKLPEDPEQEPKEEARPFIHGRHTCDSCLTTPIVGKRYNAGNLPDYDLCENCFKNYKGKEIQFKPVELDRDGAFQERWHRRREKIQHWQTRKCENGRFGSHRRQRGPRGRGGGLNRPDGFMKPHLPPGHPGPPCPPPPPCPPGDHGPPCPPPPPCPPVPPCPPPHHGPPPHHHGPPPHHHGPPPHFPWSHLGPLLGPHLAPHLAPHLGARGPNDFDDALKEAIRRSLQDIAPKEATIFAEVKPTAPVEATVVSENEEDIVVEAEVASPVKESSDDVVEEEIVIQAELPDVHSGKSTDKAVANFEEHSEPSDLEEAAEKLLEDSMFMDTDSVDSEKMVAEGEDMKNDPGAVEHEISDASKKTGADDSFASDAIGIGDVAEAMGATLDIVAGVISEMLSEADSHDEKPASVNSKDKKNSLGAIVAGVISEVLSEADARNKKPASVESKDVETAVVPCVESEDDANKKPAAIKTDGDTVVLGSSFDDCNKKPAAVESENDNVVEESSGAMILDWSKSDSFAETEESDWHVVKAEEESESPDEEIARAAEMLGSALFHSDIRSSEVRSSEENVSTLSSSDSFSLGTSVPSIVPSISIGTHSSRVAPVQRDIWASHLAKLRELGFDNEILCVDILERLTAANIGVDSEDDVSVTQVVNAILEEN